MKATCVDAWACSNCKAIQEDTIDGRARADACCTCPTCGGISTHIRSSTTLCAACGGKEELDRAKTRLKYAAADVARVRVAIAEAKKASKKPAKRGAR